MCGRFFTTSTPDELVAEFGLDKVPNEYRARYNIAPTQQVPALVLREGRFIMGTIRWGLVPPWAKDLSVGSKMINARAETVRTRPSFRSAFEGRRCLIIASGFYEWMTGEDGTKRPIAIRPLDQRPLTLAGLWERWGPEDQSVTTCTIITTEATEELSPIHHRMPVIVRPPDRRRWLDRETNLDDLEGMVQTRETPPLEYYEVSTLVNSVRNDQPECLEPVEL